MILGCDYSTKAIDIARHSHAGWTATKLYVTPGAEYLRQLKTLLGTYASWKDAAEELVIYIEQPWIGSTGGYFNPATSMALIKAAAAVENMALLEDYRVEWAHPSSWRSKVLGKAKRTKAQAKAASKAWAVTHTGLAIVDVDDNAADACCIAAYGEMRENDAD